MTPDAGPQRCLWRRAGIGGTLYDGQPVASWEMFLVDAARVLRVFDPPAAS